MSSPKPGPMPMPHRRRALVAPVAESGAAGRRGFLRNALGLLTGGAVLGATSRRAEAAPQTTQPFIGEVMLFAGTFIPSGWLACNGQIVPIASYKNLFFLIGTDYGGDGQNTFGIPDLRGSVPIHAGQSPEGTNRVAGDKGGEEMAGLALAQLPAHVHAAAARSAPGTSATPTGLVPARNAAGGLHYSPFGDADLGPDAVLPQGGGQPHANLQPFLTVTFCIATDGVWPSPS